MSNKSKTVPPLIIPKSRIQSVPNHSPASPIQSIQHGDCLISSQSKRLHSPTTSPNTLSKQKLQQNFVSKNRFSLFSHKLESTDNPVDKSPDKMDIESQHNDIESLIIKTSPIFIRTITNFSSFCNIIRDITKGEQFTCKSSLNGAKLSTQSADSYRSVIKFLQQNKADFYSYQLKEDRAFRIVIRNLHHTSSLEEIKN